MKSRPGTTKGRLFFALTLKVSHNTEGSLLHLRILSFFQMKNRDYKNFASNCYYHVFNRGVGKQDIFLDDDDRKFFLYRLKKFISRAEGSLP